MKNINIFFGLCKHLWIEFQPTESELFAQDLPWYTRLISGRGNHSGRKRLQRLIDMEVPKNEPHLQQFLYAMQWLKIAIPNCSTFISRLHFQRETLQSGKNTKQVLAKVPFNIRSCSEKDENDPMPVKVLCKRNYTLSLRSKNAASRFHSHLRRFLGRSRNSNAYIRKWQTTCRLIMWAFGISVREIWYNANGLVYFEKRSFHWFGSLRENALSGCQSRRIE